MITYERVEFWQHPPEAERVAWCDWLHRHGIDPADVPIPGWIERRISEYQVVLKVYARDAQGDIYPGPDRWDVVTETRVVQLEGPPLPFPQFPEKPKGRAIIATHEFPRAGV